MEVSSTNSFNMKKFLFKISFYLVSVIAVLLFMGTYADGNTDDNYRHFTGSKPSDMIFGDSRSAQAVVPDVLDQRLKGRTFNNFSLNIAESPYGKIYFEAIKKKLDPATQNGIFIVTVDPWNVSLPKKEISEKEYSENNSALADMYFYDKAPNYEYLLKHYTRSWFNIFREREAIVKSNTYLHKNGWMEVNVNVSPDTVRARRLIKIDQYKDLAKVQKIASYRLNALGEIISYLKDHGRVYLVRIPASEEILEIENRYSPDFNTIMKDVAKKNKVRFLDFTPQNKQYLYTDGNHMYRESARVFTAQIADSIQGDQKSLR